MAKKIFKPLLFTTTMRNPERLKDFLTVFSQYDGKMLTNDIIDNVAKQLIQEGLYQPMKVSIEVKRKWKHDIVLTEEETEKVFNDNPQSHKEAGFEKGWASRFDTWFKIAKELGFVYYWQGQIIAFSESGKMLLDKEKPQNEQMVFVNAFAKYQRHNPFRRVLNENVPLILLIETIQYLNADTDFNGAGISRQEIPILLCWKDNNAQELYKTIKELRKKYGYSPSDEMILEVCDTLLDDTKRDENSIMSDYPDDFIRKMRLTGLVTVRGGGRFIDINTKEIETVNFILRNYRNYSAYASEKAFFEYIGKVDTELIKTLIVYKSPIRTTNKELEKWVEHYQWEAIKTEMMNLSENKSSKDDILKVIERPLRLEFLTTLAILKKLPNVTVKPNFVSDDEGLPTSFASGGNPDIECTEDKQTILVEVTLLTGTQQHIRESYSVHRHLEDFINKGHKAFTLFVSPRVFVDTCRNAAFVKFQYGLDLKILNIDLFLQQLESNNTLQNVAFTASSCI
jgi:hypothetical protein